MAKLTNLNGSRHLLMQIRYTCQAKLTEGYMIKSFYSISYNAAHVLVLAYNPGIYFPYFSKNLTQISILPSPAFYTFQNQTYIRNFLSLREVFPSHLV